MKMRRVSWLLAAFMLSGTAVCAQETVGTEQIGTENVTEDGASEAGALSGAWSDYQIQIGEQVYQFPMMYEDFVALGWTAKDTEGEELEPNQYSLYRFSKGDVVSTAYILNLGMNVEPVERCIVAGIDIDKYDWDEAEDRVLLPSGIERCVSDLQAVEEAYGIPSDTYEGDLYTQYTYETDYNSYVEMKFFKESGLLEEIVVKNFVEPEGFDAGEVSEAVPAAVLAYEKPESLSRDPLTYQIGMDGEIYELPVPVSVLAEDGWEIDESGTDPAIKAGYFGWVTLRKGGQEISEIAVNPERTATIAANCWIETLDVGGYSLDMQGALPGDITTGMTEEAFTNILDAAGVPYEMEESGDFRYYTYNAIGYSQCLEAVVYTGIDGNFEQNTVMEVICRNTIE